MNPGDGRHITTDDGCITAVTGRGALAVRTSAITVGGDLHSSRSISRLATIIAGIRFTTTSGIHTLVTIVTPLLSD